ncbi:MAG: OmpA family protein [Pseudomonadota bacterium]
MMRALALVLIGSAAGAVTLEIPAGAELTREVSVESGARAIATGPTQDGFTPTTLAQGAVTIQAWRVPGALEPAALLEPVAAGLSAAGFETLFSCETQSCGGFDFRFSLRLIPPPDMFVDLGDYVFFSAAAPEGSAYVSVVASRSASDGYLHIARVTTTEAPEIDTVSAPLPDTAPAPAEETAPPSDLAAALEANGRVVLEDLIFPSGTITLPNDDYPSLTALAAYLGANPTRQVALVGHTDSSGALSVNVAISQERAAVARAKLIARYGVSEAQVTAEGMGYLAPRDTNLTEDGRQRNRRVEVVLLSTE